MIRASVAATAAIMASAKKAPVPQSLVAVHVIDLSARTKSKKWTWRCRAGRSIA
jgi:hypothetical protein